MDYIDLLVELFRDLARRRQTFRSDQQPAFRVKCGRCQYDVLGAVCQFPFPPLSNDNENKAYDT
jgi:hypothetical protein